MKFFDKNMTELGILKTNVTGILNNIASLDRNITNISKRDKTINDLSEVIHEQNKIINDLINNIYSQDTSLEAVMIKPYRGNPVLYKDGKRLDTDRMTSFYIDWSYNSRIDISVRSE